MKNHSKTDCLRFAWPDHPQLKFSPQVGHLHPNTAKDMTVTFKSDQPKALTESPILCKVTKITFDKPLDKVSDWDDRIRTVKWIDVPTSPQPSSEG
jgi:hydrocephalus-inducing protein